MLLNTDLHDPVIYFIIYFSLKILDQINQLILNLKKIQNKMTLNEFIENLKGLNSGSNFPDVLLESLYSAIKNEPLECAG
jgi:Sec7-like guanine-nucleotide exchange factor